ncbi:B/F/G family RNA polymerase sigma-70 factor, partial [Streptomyces hygroscopicus]
AEELGISQMHVSRLITRSCRAIRNQVEADPRTEQAPVAA